jgi:hypothetical protein
LTAWLAVAEPIVTNPVAAVVIAVPLLLRVSVLFAPLVYC